MTTNYFESLAAVNCSAHVEKKGKFSYLSWPFAMSELAKRHPDASIEVREWDGFPAIRGPKGWMVQVSVTIEGVRRSQWHPVLDGANKAIPEPSVFEINTSIQRATVKAIALHGLGLYIYAGEDLPEGAEDAAKAEEANAQQAWIDAATAVSDDIGYQKLRNEVLAKFGDVKKVPKPVAAALGAAMNRVTQAAAA